MASAYPQTQQDDRDHRDRRRDDPGPGRVGHPEPGPGSAAARCRGSTRRTAPRPRPAGCRRSGTAQSTCRLLCPRNISAGNDTSIATPTIDRAGHRTPRPASDSRPAAASTRAARTAVPSTSRMIRANRQSARHPGSWARPRPLLRQSRRTSMPRVNGSDRWACPPACIRAAGMIRSGAGLGGRDDLRVQLVGAGRPGDRRRLVLAEEHVPLDQPAQPFLLVQVDVPDLGRPAAAPWFQRSIVDEQVVALGDDQPGGPVDSGMAPAIGCSMVRSKPGRVDHLVLCPRAAGAAARRIRARRTCPAPPCGRAGRAVPARRPRGGSRPSVRGPRRPVVLERLDQLLGQGGLAGGGGAR